MGQCCWPKPTRVQLGVDLPDLELLAGLEPVRQDLQEPVRREQALQLA